jgi:hypothetical protein
VQQWHKEPRPETEATSRKQEGIQQDRQADFRIRSREVSSQNFHRVMDSE